MARGKHAAQAARRRAEVADQQIAELKATLESERSAWRSERADLKAEAQALRNRLTSEVTALSKAEVARIRETAIAEKRELQEKFAEQAQGAVDLLASFDAALDMHEYKQIRETLGLDTKEVRDFIAMREFVNQGSRNGNFGMSSRPRSHER